jgi:hypothetical protein
MYRLSLIVDGDTTIETFRAAVSRFFAMLHEVDESVCGGRFVRWRLESFHHGSPPVVTCVAG